jgi:hypothetical protein
MAFKKEDCILVPGSREAVRSYLLDPKLTFLNDETCFHLCGYVNVQDNRYWRITNHRQILKHLFTSVVCGVVWCAITAIKIVEPIICEQTITSDQCVTDILQPFFQSTAKGGKT